MEAWLLYSIGFSTGSNAWRLFHGDTIGVTGSRRTQSVTKILVVGGVAEILQTILQQEHSMADVYREKRRIVHDR